MKQIYEYIDDGVTWAGGKVVEGASWLVGESAGLFSEDKKNSIMNRRKDIKENVKNEIDRDKVGELNEWFYENTKVLTHKIAYLIGEKNVKPWQILAITFTNKLF